MYIYVYIRLKVGSVTESTHCGAVFEPFQDAKTNTLLPKVAFVALNLAAMGLGLWKVRLFVFVW